MDIKIEEKLHEMDKVEAVDYLWRIITILVTALGSTATTLGGVIFYLYKENRRDKMDNIKEKSESILKLEKQIEMLTLKLNEKNT